MLGLKDEAEKYAAVLSYNYPSGSWLHNARNLLK
jgi:outer membrane protein assembly factor BamD (BamD/ComL family)